jgi:hypothetical protein
LLLALIIGIAWLRLERRAVSLQVAERGAAAGCRSAGRDFRGRRDAVWITVAARVERLLSDTHGRYQHQRFTVRCAGGQTLLIVNDVSIGTRVPARPGSSIVVHGQYVWNALGGLIHFTHHDPEGGPGGWILYAGKVYALEVSPRPSIQ